MCAQCMAGAMTAGAAATGIKAWLAVRGIGGRLVTGVLLAAGLAGAALIGS